MMQELIEQILVPAITAIVGATIAWLTTRKKENVEVEGGLIVNAKAVLDMSEQITERLEAQILKSDAVIHALKDTIINMESEKNACEEARKALELDLENYKALYLEQVEEVQALRKDCDALRVLLNGQPKIQSNEN